MSGQVLPLQDTIHSILQAQKDAKRPVRLVVMVAELFQTQAGEHQNGVHTDGLACAYIGDTITDEDGIAQVDTQFVAGTQQLARAWFTAGAIGILGVRTVIDLLYRSTHLLDSGDHPSMNLFHRLLRNEPTRNTCLVTTDHNAMPGSC